MKIFHHDREAPATSESRDVAEPVSSVPREDAQAPDNRGAPDLPKVLEGDQHQQQQPVPSKPYLAIPKRNPAVDAEPKLIRWGEFKAIIDEQVKDDQVIAFIDWDPPHGIKVEKLTAGVAIRNIPIP